MKKVIYPLILSLIVPTLLYLTFSFGSTSFNIKTWHSLSLILCPLFMLFGIIIGIVLGLMVNEEIEKQKK